MMITDWPAGVPGDLQLTPPVCNGLNPARALYCLTAQMHRVSGKSSTELVMTRLHSRIYVYHATRSPWNYSLIRYTVSEGFTLFTEKMQHFKTFEFVCFPFPPQFSPPIYTLEVLDS